MNALSMEEISQLLMSIAEDPNLDSDETTILTEEEIADLELDTPIEEKKEEVNYFNY